MSLIILFTDFFSSVLAINPDSTSYVSITNVSGSFILSNMGQSAPLFVSSHDYKGVKRALSDLQSDIRSVTNATPHLYVDTIPAIQQIIIVGTLGKSPIIDTLVKNQKLDVSGITGKWETFVIQVVDNPMPGINRGLVIVGSDKRGTIFGIYDLSAQIGVSPWYWWADVPVMKKQSIYILPGRYSQGEPAVKYRGFFINDERPSLVRWAYQKYGGLDHRFYAKVFELLLRLKANFLWPAMWWNNSFAKDDTLNQQLADDYGIVMGTSHEEPMMRAENEWKLWARWNYNTNAAAIRNFWKQGIKRMGSRESLVTIGMRGRMDTRMKGGANLLQQIITDQRQIIGDVTGKDPSTVPQVFALYKEIQTYYDQGMQVPDDVTLLLSDDNWGNIRRLLNPRTNSRSGGYGIYYHFDYVGGPRSYKWVNTNPIPRVWEQMHLAYDHGANRIWIVNVGDIKPMEFPIEFFMDYAWAPNRWPAERLHEYTRRWVDQQFGPDNDSIIANIITKYTKYNGRRKPELLSGGDQPGFPYSLVNYKEAGSVVNEYKALTDQADQIYQVMPENYKPAFYQLVLYPVKACSNLNELFYTVKKNSLYYYQGRAATNDLADRVEYLFLRDASYSNYYNKVLSGGKWDHMMDQTHISYKKWRQPTKDIIPPVYRLKIPNAAEMGVSIEGSESFWTKDTIKTILPEFDPYMQQTSYIEVFNRGKTPFDYAIRTGPTFLLVTPQKGTVEKENRLWVSVNWNQVPPGKQQIPITITGPNGKKVTVLAVINNPASPKPQDINGFIESNKYIAIEAEHYTQAINSGAIKWQRIPDLGRTLSAVTAFPDTSQSQMPGGNCPHLEYSIYLFDTGQINIQAYFSPTINFYNNSKPLHYGISLDNEQPQIMGFINNGSSTLADNIVTAISKHQISQVGQHILKFWMVDPSVVLQKLVVYSGSIGASYLGPPEVPYDEKKRPYNSDICR